MRLRRSALAGLTMLATLWGADAAQATIPARVADNLRGIAEFQYKLFSTSQDPDRRFPTCHRVCTHLWNLQLQLDTGSDTDQAVWRQLSVLGKRDGLFKGFTDYTSFSTTIPTTDGNEKNIFGDFPWREDDPPRRYLGVTMPAISGTGIETTMRLAQPGERVMVSGAGDNHGHTWESTVDSPELAWYVVGPQVWHGEDCGGTGGSAAPAPPHWVRLSVTLYCQYWVGDDMFVEAAGEWYSYFYPARFDGPPSVTPGSYTNTNSHNETALDPGIGNAEVSMAFELTNHEADFLELISWLDIAFGGDGHFSPTPQSLFGASNPAAPNLTHTCAGDPVDCSTGNFSETYQDTQVNGPGVTLSQARTYNSQDAAASSTTGPFGFGWSGSFRDRLEFPTTTDIVVHQENGSQVRFSLDDEDGTYRPDNYVQAKLTEQTDGTWLYRLPTQLTLRFSATGRLLSETDRNGNATAMTYSGANLTEVTDPVGRDLTFTYNTNGTVATATDPAGHVVTYGYTAGELTSVTDVGGATTQFAYGTDHQLTTITDPLANTTVTNTYDSSHRVIAQEDALGHETTWAYTTNHTTITDPSGSVTEETFANNLPVTVTKADGTASEATTHYAYDEDYNLVKVTDPNGEEWTSEYDIHGNRTKSTDPLGRSTRYEYDGAHRVTRTTSPRGLDTRASYDSHGNLTYVSESTDPWHVLKNTSFDYGDYGLQTRKNETRSSGSRWWDYHYDAEGNMTSVRSPANHTSRSTYDDNGFALTSTTPRGKVTTTVRNAYELPTTVTDPRGKVTTYAYDAALNRTDVTDRDSRHTVTTFDELNRPVSTLRPDGTTWSIGYTSTGEVASRTDGAGEATTYTYDHQHRLRSATDPLSRVTTYGYDPAGNKTSVENAAGQTTTLGYDDANQLTSVDYSSSGTPDVDYTYDLDGQRASMVDGTGTTTYDHDILDRLVSQTTGAGQTTTYHYDGWDRVVSIDYPDGLTPVTVGSGTPPTHVTTGTVTREYDPDDHLTSVTDWLSNTTSFSYDDDGELTGVTRPNGVNATFTYDDSGVLSSLTDNGPGTALGRTDERLLTSTDDGTTTVEFGNDAAERLTSGFGRTYTYDNADNLTQTATPAGAAIAQHFDDANQLTSRTSGATTLASFDYDDEGRRVDTTPGSGVATHLDWSQGDDLVGYSGPDVSGVTSGTVSESYGYDGDGLRRTKVAGGQRTHEAYDISGGLSQMILDGPTAYITGPGGLPLEQITSAGTARWFHQDQLGSTTSLTSTSGATVQSYTYDAYGQPTSATPTVENPFRYAGQYTDDQTGFQNLRARYYDPATGQFLSRDPLEDSTLQPYAYADNNPTNATDPSGLAPWDYFSKSSFTSDAVAGGFNALTLGASTRLAGAFFHFDVDCADFGPGFQVGEGVVTAASMFTGEGEAILAAKGVTRINSAKALLRSAEESGPYHNFPGSLDEAIYAGKRTVVSDDYVQYTLRGTYTKPGRFVETAPGEGTRAAEVIRGTYEVGVRPSASGRTEVVVHRFFRPDR
jgi:RHS repeat-associated protein